MGREVARVQAARGCKRDFEAADPHRILPVGPGGDQGVQYEEIPKQVDGHWLTGILKKSQNRVMGTG